MGTQLDPVEQKVHEKTLAMIRQSFPQEAIEGAVEDARHLSAEEAFARAIESADWAESQLTAVHVSRPNSLERLVGVGATLLGAARYQIGVPTRRSRCGQRAPDGEIRHD
jgi:hypothetical protein